ncbi:MAG: N-acetylmuramoyl-L-alanine amidase [Clostridia bacterium]|nr:N-acetylmuramoyl-L-alanine amidase [Clostridia bacterium]
MANFKIALTAGHYKGTPGKRCLKSLDPKETREWVLNDRIADKVEKLLRNYTGYELLRTDDTTGNKDISLTARTNAANSFGADFYLSVHHNAGIGGGSGGGIVAIVYNSASAESVAWQKELYNALIKETGLKGNRSTPLAKMNLHEVRETNMPAVLLELGFMDSKTDVPVILTEKFADQCAKAIVDVVVKRGKLTKKATPTATATETKTAENFETASVQALLREAYEYDIVKTYVKPIDNKKGKLTKAAILEAKAYLGYKNADVAVNLQFITDLDAVLSAKRADVQSVIAGDVNGDGKVTVQDATEIQKQLAGIQ